MRHFLFSILVFGLSVQGIRAQSSDDSVLLPARDSVLVTDSVPKADTVAMIIRADSVSKRPRVDSSWLLQPVATGSAMFKWEVLRRNPFFDFKSKPITKEGASLKKFRGKEFVFYLLVFLLLVFAVFRQLFPKYFSDLFRVFFRTTLKQTQIREQLMQTPVPSLMLNGFFVVSAGLYITFLIEHFGNNPVSNFWLLFFYCCVGLSVAYLVKFLGLKVTGWVFDLGEATDAYIFIVFVINKMIGILLLPLLIILAFSVGAIYSVSITVSWCLLTGIYLYRLILSYSVIRNQIRVNPFHFFLYFCAFEIAPLLLVYRGLLVFFNVTT